MPKHSLQHRRTRSYCVRAFYADGVAGSRIEWHWKYLPEWMKRLYDGLASQLPKPSNASRPSPQMQDRHA